MKTCSKCKIEKELTEFYKDKTKSDGFRKTCKSCKKESNNLYKEQNKEKILERNRLSYHKNKDKDSYKQKRKEWRETNKQNISEKRKEWTLINKELISQNKKDYYEKNKEEILSKRKDYYQKLKSDNISVQRLRDRGRRITKKWRDDNKLKISESIKERKKTDPVYKLIDSIRTLIWISIKRMNFDKSKKTEIILGCSFEEFIKHIESQFKEGMTWQNHGEWHLDHKTPISWASTIEEVYELNHYTNFQPLWAFENLSKNNKWCDE